MKKCLILLLTMIFSGCIVEKGSRFRPASDRWFIMTTTVMSTQLAVIRMIMNILTRKQIAFLELYQWSFVILIGSAQVV